MRWIALWSGLLFWGVAFAAAADCDKLEAGGFFETATLEEVTDWLEGGADLKTLDKDGKTPLHRAAKWSDSPDVVSVLLEAGADPNARGQVGLHPSARSGNVE